MSLSKYLHSIREKIAADDLFGAIQQLRTLLDNARQLDEVILQSARFQAIRTQIRLGTVSHTEANLTQNQIRAGLLDLLRAIEAQSAQPVLREEAEPKAQLILHYGTKSEPQAGGSAEYLFEGIPANFQGEALRLQFSAPGFVPVDTSFFLEKETLVLPVRRNDDLAILTGLIKDEAGQPLEGVRVSIPCCAVLTDASGAFTLRIPPAQQRSEQRLELFKAGYAPKSTSTPVFPGEVFRERLDRK